MPNDVDCLIIGDFNLLRKPEDTNRPSDNAGEMLLFNEAISSLGIDEIRLHGRWFTWTNKQQPPLLERLDCFFFIFCLDPQVSPYYSSVVHHRDL
jgi:hypothetical protein